MKQLLFIIFQSISYLGLNAQSIENKQSSLVSNQADSSYDDKYNHIYFSQTEKAENINEYQPIKKKKINLELVIAKWFKIGLYSHNNVIPMQLMK